MRRFLLLVAAVAVVAGGLVAALALNDSSSDTPPGKDGEGSPRESPSVPEESPRSPDDSPQETTVVGASSPKEASERLLQAWIDSDRQDALEVAETRAVESLFRLRPAPGYELKGCQTEGTGHSCAFFLESGGGAGAALLMLVEGSEESGFRVNQVKSIGAD